jgi:hypothetical protein
MTIVHRKSLALAIMTLVVFVGLSLLFHCLSSTTTGAGTEDELDLGVTGWLQLIRNRDGWHVASFHFWPMLLEMIVAVVLALVFSRGHSFVGSTPPVVKKRTFYPAAVLLGVIALILNSVGHGLVAEYSSRRAHAISMAYTQHVKYVADAETARLLRTGNALNVIGLLFTVSGIACLAAALARREHGWHLILAGSLLLDIMILMLL